MTITKEMLAQKYAAMEEASQAIADALNEGKAEKDVKPLKETCKTATNDYNKANEEYYYNSLVAKYGPDALKEGVKTYSLPGAKKPSQREDKKTGRYMSQVKDDKKAVIDLINFMDIIGIDYFANADWFTRTQRFAFIVANAINKALGEDPEFAYHVDKAAQEFEFADDADPASANSGRKALQACVNAIVFIPSEKDESKNMLKVEKRHWAFVRETMSAHGKGKLEVSVRGTAGVAALITEVVSGLLCSDRIRLIADEG